MSRYPILPTPNNHSITCHMLFGTDFLLLSFHILTFSSKNRSRKYTINESIYIDKPAFVTNRKCTLGKVNDKSYVIYLHKTNVIDPFCDFEIFLVVPGVWLPT